MTINSARLWIIRGCGVLCLIGLLGFVTAVSRGQESPEKDPPADTPRDDDAESQDEEEPAMPRQPDPRDIIRQLREERAPNVPILPAGTPKSRADGARAAFDPVSPNAQIEPLLPEGSYLVDRTGRLVKSGPWWTFVMEGSSQVVRSRPLRLLPSQLLTTMEQASGSADRGILFVISGEITEYEGINYVLLRKVLIHRGTGNLGGDQST